VWLNENENVDWLLFFEFPYRQFFLRILRKLVHKEEETKASLLLLQPIPNLPDQTSHMQGQTSIARLTTTEAQKKKNVAALHAYLTSLHPDAALLKNPFYFSSLMLWP
jgi:hypothetical protein